VALNASYTGNAYFNFNDQPVAAVGQDICGKRLSSCEARFAQQRIGGYVNLGGNYISNVSKRLV
jgi:lambda family phage minor tail protein L